MVARDSTDRRRAGKVAPELRVQCPRGLRVAALDGPLQRQQESLAERHPRRVPFGRSFGRPRRSAHLRDRSKVRSRPLTFKIVAESDAFGRVVQGSIPMRFR